MEITRGTVIKSMAGHDKGNIYTVLSNNEKSVMICDGKKRKLDCLKKKNIKHIEATNYVINEKFLISDCSIRKALSKYRCNL